MLEFWSTNNLYINEEKNLFNFVEILSKFEEIIYARLLVLTAFCGQCYDRFGIHCQTNF